MEPIVINKTDGQKLMNAKRPGPKAFPASMNSSLSSPIMISNGLIPAIAVIIPIFNTICNLFHFFFKRM